MSCFSDRLTELMELKKISNYKMAKDLGLSPSTIANYKEGLTNPGIPILDAIAKYLDVTKEYILNENSNNRNINTTTIIMEEGKEDEKIKGLEKQIELYKEIIKSKDEMINYLKNDVKKLVETTIKTLQDEIASLKQRNACYDFVDEKKLSAKKG